VSDLNERMQQFNRRELPGQPRGMHMGTAYLINDLWTEVQRLQAALDAANAERDAARNQMLDMAGEYNAMEAALNAANDLSHARAVEIDRLQDELDAANADRERLREALKDAYFCRLSLERFAALTATPSAGGGTNG